MTKSPCIGCDLETKDKNNPTCRECKKRVWYAFFIEEDIMGTDDLWGASDRCEARERRQRVGGGFGGFREPGTY